MNGEWAASRGRPGSVGRPRFANGGKVGPNIFFAQVCIPAMMIWKNAISKS